MKTNLLLSFRQAQCIAITLFAFNFITLQTFDCFAQTVNIPDANFKAKLVANYAINTNHDGEIQSSEAAAYNGIMYVGNSSISDLTGIEAFTVLTYLNCGYNQLTSLNLTSNTALKMLYCYYNQLTSLNLSANTALTALGCNNNQLTSLNLSANTALNTLWCSYNQLTSLNLSANTALNYLWCNNNQLTNLNLVYNTALTELVCVGNQLTSLNLSANTVLTSLDCNGNQLTSLNVSANTALDTLWCYNNQLTSLDIKNGNNINLSNFNAINNPNLSCIQVDDTDYMNSNWDWAKDTTASYSEDCIITIPTAPTNLTLASLKNILSNMILSWTDNSNNEDGFRIYRSTDDVNYAEIGTTAANINTYADVTGAASTLYYYRVTAYNSAGSSTFSNTANGITTGINEISVNNTVTVYPNPTTGKLAVSLNNANIGTIEIYNLIGEKVYANSYNQQKSTEIDISNSPSGIYFLKIGDGVQVYTSKIVVQ